MGDSVETKADATAAVGNKTAVVVKKKAKTAKRVVGVAVNNFSDRMINTSVGSIKPGEDGRATLAEVRQYRNFIKELGKKDE